MNCTFGVCFIADGQLQYSSFDAETLERWLVKRGVRIDMEPILHSVPGRTFSFITRHQLVIVHEQS